MLWRDSEEGHILHPPETAARAQQRSPARSPPSGIPLFSGPARFPWLPVSIPRWPGLTYRSPYPKLRARGVFHFLSIGEFSTPLIFRKMSSPEARSAFATASLSSPPWAAARWPRSIASRHATDLSQRTMLCGDQGRKSDEPVSDDSARSAVAGRIRVRSDLQQIQQACSRHRLRTRL